MVGFINADACIVDGKANVRNIMGDGDRDDAIWLIWSLVTGAIQSYLNS